MSPLDENLVQQCITGDTRAFNALVEKYKNAIYAVGLQYFRNTHDAEDIAQETFIRAYCKRPMNVWSELKSRKTESPTFMTQGLMAAKC